MTEAQQEQKDDQHERVPSGQSKIRIISARVG
jgi:hypothetical protein